MALAPGSRLGPYEIVAQLGAGGMGEVYRARDTRLGRDVALKVLPQSFIREGDRLRRFEQEAQAVAALNHPNILGIYDVGQHDGAPFLITELLEGESLREKLEGGPVPQRWAIDCAVQISQGLAAAHGKGIVHRDLKPDNIFVTKGGGVKSPRLWPGQAHVEGRRRHVTGRRPNHDQRAHRGRGGDGHGELHGAGAGAGRGDRRPQRHFCLRRGALRDAGGQARLPPRHARRNHDGRVAGRPAGADGPGPSHCAGA